MALNHKIYDNYFLSNEVEDQFNSHLDLLSFCTVDNSLVGTPGMKRKINVYSATNGTEKLEMGEGNSKSIEVTYADKEYEILLGELTQYNPELLDKSRILAITKCDMLDDELIEEMTAHLPEGIKSVFISSVAGLNIAKLKDMLWAALHE